MMSIRSTLAIAGLALAVAACQGKSSSENAPTLGGAPAQPASARADLPPDVGLQLDSGNLAFRQKDYQAALEHYKRANQAGPHISATWYGIAMAEGALGDSAAADSAMAMAQKLAPGQNLVHPTGPVTDTTHP